MSRTKQLLTTLLVVIIVANAAIAATNTVFVGGGTPIGTQSGLDVTATSDQQFDLENAWVRSDAVELNNVTFSGSGGSTDVTQFENGRTNLTNVNAASGGITVNKATAQNNTTVQDDITKASIADPTPVKEGDTDLVYSASTDSNVTFETNGNGVVAVDLSSGNTIDEASPNGDGTATVNLPQATDNAIGLQEGPNTLTIRSTDDPQGKVTTPSTVNVTFFERSSDRVFTRQASNAEVSFEGLPKTSSFVARTEADGFVDRRVLIDSIFEQESVFLLNESRDTVNTSFSVTDNTGRFGEDSTIQIQRALNTTDSPDGELRYVNVAGATLGETREFETELERGVRYRIVVSNRDGQQRQLGSVVPSRDRVFNLEITTLNFNFDKSGSTATVQTNQTVSGEGANKTKTLEFTFNDSANETTALSGTIHERGNASNVLTTFSPQAGDFPLGQFRFSTTASGAAANSTYVVNYSYERLGQQQQAVEPFVGQQFDVDFPLESGWQSIFGVGLLIVLAGVFSLGNARIGALIIPGVALLLFQIGFLSGTVSLLGIGMAFSVAVAYNLAQTSNAVLGP